MWALKGKPDYSMSGNGLLAGLVAITAPSGFVSTAGACIIGLVAGVLVCLSCSFFDNTLKVDDPVGGGWPILSQFSADKSLFMNETTPTYLCRVTGFVFTGARPFVGFEGSWFR
jgi:hypothetical protein